MTDLVTLYNYKEPLKNIPENEGFGYYGALRGTPDKKSIQCHICGKLFKSLDKHIVSTHKIKLKEYRQKYQLSFQTALISENIRQDRKQNLINWLATLTEEQKKEHYKKQSERLKENNKKGYHRTKLSLEHQNKRGRCPDQILDKIREIKEKLGHIPTQREFIEETGGQRYIHLIREVYGKWNNALKILKYDISNIHKSKQKIGGNHKTYTEDELLEYLFLYTQEHQKIPTASDFRREYLPRVDIYVKHFGTLENARRLAGVYDIIQKNS